MPSEYERAAAEARRRQRMAELLASQEYDPSTVQNAPIPAAAPLVQGLQAFIKGRLGRQAEEALEKAEAADVEEFENLYKSIRPQERAVTGPDAFADPMEMASKYTAPRMEMYTPSEEEKRTLLERTAFGKGSPSAKKYATALLAEMDKKPKEEEFGTTPVLSESGEYVLFGKGGTARPTGVRGAPKDQNLTPYQREMLRLRERELGIRERGMGPGGQKPMSPTTQRELFETDENILATQTGIDLLQTAKTLSPKAFEGPLAEKRAQAATLLPDEIEPAGAKETLEFDLLVKQQVLPQLRTIFGAAPTEGERAILLELQGSSSLPKKVRDSVLNRAIQAAQRRLQFNKQKSDQLRSGTYFQEAPAELGNSLPSGFELDQ